MYIRKYKYEDSIVALWSEEQFERAKYADEGEDEDHDFLDGDEEFTCPWCQATVGAESILGTLSKRTHCRCRYCGGDFSHTED